VEDHEQDGAEAEAAPIAEPVADPFPQPRLVLLVRGVPRVLLPEEPDEDGDRDDREGESAAGERQGGEDDRDGPDEDVRLVGGDAEELVLRD